MNKKLKTEGAKMSAIKKQFITIFAILATLCFAKKTISEFR